MYEVTCENCGPIGFHPSRVGAESLADRHADEAGHEVGVDPMDGP